MAAVLTSCCLPLAWITPLSAQDNDSRHVRVQFSGGAAWSEIGPKNGAYAPLPAGPARANYGLGVNGKSAPLAQGAPIAQVATPQEHLRLKPMNLGGM